MYVISAKCFYGVGFVDEFSADTLEFSRNKALIFNDRIDAESAIQVIKCIWHITDDLTISKIEP